jgi:hypothetical protein
MERPNRVLRNLLLPFVYKKEVRQLRGSYSIEDLNDADA